MLGQYVLHIWDPYIYIEMFGLHLGNICVIWGLYFPDGPQQWLLTEIFIFSKNVCATVNYIVLNECAPFKSQLFRNTQIFIQISIPKYTIYCVVRCELLGHLWYLWALDADFAYLFAVILKHYYKDMPYKNFCDMCKRWLAFRQVQ